jgi:putative glutamine amidotransferase
MKRALIGIPGSKSSTQFGASENHLEFIEHFGDAVIIMPFETQEDLRRYDAIYMPGGLDLNPTAYRKSPSYKNSNIDVFKEHFYKVQLPWVIQNGTPVFGVCLGMQSIAAYFGATLTRNLLFHAQSPNRWEVAHQVFPTEHCVKYGGTIMEVNSHHHQALTQSGLDKGSPIIPLYYAPNEDSKIKKQGDIIEAITIDGKNIFGVQWHPEELYDDFSINILTSLCELRHSQQAKQKGVAAK